jgi:hypothetical protein
VLTSGAAPAKSRIGGLLQRNFDLALISGTLRQQPLYSRLGFLPFAHPVGSEQAMYQPMQLPPGRAGKNAKSVRRRTT